MGIKAKGQIDGRKSHCLRMDETLSKLYGIQFFFSSVTETKNNAKEQNTGKDKKQPSQENTTEDEGDPSKGGFTRVFPKVLSWCSILHCVYSHQRMQSRYHFCIACFIILITMLKSKQLIQGLKVVRRKILRPKK